LLRRTGELEQHDAAVRRDRDRTRRVGALRVASARTFAARLAVRSDERRHRARRWFYVDGVLYARPASTALDFIDVDRIEVLRGPQGTLFGKNTTAGAVLVTTRKPSRTNGASFEFGYGNDGFVQAKGSLTGRSARKEPGGCRSRARSATARCTT